MSLAETPDTVNGRLPGFEDRGSDAPGPPRGQGRASERDEPSVMDPAPMPVSLLLACSRVKSPDGDTWPQLAAPPGADGPERRVVPRHESIKLTPGERTRLREMTARALGCRSTLVAMRRSRPDGQSVTEDRLVMAVPCGTRMCEPCDADRRRREAARVEGHWRLFYTLGVPSGFWDAGKAWRLVGFWARSLFRELRRELADGRARNVVVDQDERDRIAALNEARAKGKRAAPVLQYAWCLEPHKSGWPHIHFVTNASFIAHEWIKKLWSRIIGSEVRWARYEKVTDRDGVCRYLSKYISKTTFSPDIVAIMYRRRQWASTVPPMPKKTAEWRLEERREGEDLFSETVFPSIFARVNGWKESLSKAGEYAMFSRSFTVKEWEEYEKTRHRADRFDRQKVYLEDGGWDDFERGMRDKIASALGQLRAREYRDEGISDTGKRAEKALKEAYLKRALRDGFDTR